MRVRIGAIGPADSLRVIREVAGQNPAIELVEFEYSNHAQLAGILTKHRYEVAQWIFSGPVPYYHSLEKGLITEEEAFFPPLHGMALLGTCLQVMVENGGVINKMSLDIVDESTVQSVFEEYDLQSIHFELLPFKGYLDYDELIEFHVEKFRTGKSAVALTCLLNVHLELQRRGIPSYRITPSKLAIKTVLDILVSKAQSFLYEKQKVAIIGFEVLQRGAPSKKVVYSYEEKKKELELKQELLDVAKRLNGSLISKGDGTHLIYTTHGDYELMSANISISQLAREITMRTSVEFYIGIGSGYTIYDAEQHVQIAFEQAGKNKTCSIAYVNEERLFKDLTGVQVNYMTITNQLPEYWRKILKKNHYKETIPIKLYQYVKMKNLTRFTSETMTALLRNSDRNTRRILNELEGMNLIRAVVEEKHSGKPGRPKKVYELVMEEEKQRK
ncbi:MAG TPA: hypothetical protein VK947_07050 [Planococcus sp. (in: firmicutes)]|nr:hypothetical protein [Planococcus sp. (in: firmicutes)]